MLVRDIDGEQPRRILLAEAHDIGTARLQRSHAGGADTRLGTVHDGPGTFASLPHEVGTQPFSSITSLVLYPAFLPAWNTTNPAERAPIP